MSYDQNQVAFIDIETTGLDPEYQPIWEIAVIVDGVEHVWQQRIPHWRMWTPETHPQIDAWVLENTGLRERYDDATALNPWDSIAQLESLVKGRHLVGACPWFDSERLHRAQLAETDHRSLLWHYHLIDVENLAIGFLAGASAYGDGLTERWGDGIVDVLPWDSAALSFRLGVDPADFEPKHSALADARWAKALYEKIMGPPR